MKLPVLCLLLAVSCAPAQAQTANNSNLSDHERDVARESDRNTKYHNNADDQIKIDTNALAAKIAAGFKPPPKNEVFAPKVSAETEREWAAHDKLLAQYRAGDADAGYALGMSAYVGRPFGMNKEGAYTLWSSVADRNVKARYWAGRLLYAGEGTPPDEARGLAMMESARTSGDTDAAAYVTALRRMRSTIGEFPPMICPAQSVFVWRRQRFIPYDAKREKYVREMVKRVEQHSNRASSSDYEVTAIQYLYGIGATQDLVKARTYLATSRQMNPSEYNYSPDQHLMWLDLMEADKNPDAFIAQVNKYCAKKLQQPRERVPQGDGR